MPWDGPFADTENGGISQSLLNEADQCPYRLYLYAILGLRPKEEPSPQLIWGDTLHKGLEWYLKSSYVEARDKMLDYLAEKYPHAPTTFPASLQRMLLLYERMEGTWVTELVFDHRFEYNLGGKTRNVRLRGKLDGLCIDHPDRGRAIVEHKAKTYIDPVKTRREIKHDRQCNLYMRLHNTEWVYYDLILNPEVQKYVPVRGYTQSDDEYISMLFSGPSASYGGMFPINSNKSKWLSQEPYFISHEEQEHYWNFFLIPAIERLVTFWEYVTQPGFDPEDPNWYNHIFYRMPVRNFIASNTKNFECKYYSYLLGEEGLNDLEPVPSYFGELEE